MVVRLRKPTRSQLGELLERARVDALTYSPAGISLGGAVPAGLKRRQWSTALGTGAFSSAAEALRSWTMHRGAGLVVLSDEPLAEGAIVAFSAPLPIGFVDGTCRVVAVIDEPDRYGFAYGTLGVHPEQGEESFVVTRDESGEVRLEIVGVSRPVQTLARLVPAVADGLQDRGVRRYLAAMRRAVGDEVR